MQEVTVRVPGTSANLGPGFDSLGLAVDCWNEFTFVTGQARDADDLPVRAFREASALLGVEPLSVRATGGGVVPRTRGLGSSSTCVVAGVLAAAAMNGLALSQEDAVRLATVIEGHPDNVAPAIMGGVVAAAVDGQATTAVRVPVARRHEMLALIPDQPLSTEAARAALPETLSRADAVFNISRAALLVAALGAGDDAALATALQDRVHQRQRAHLIPGVLDLIAEAVATGALGAWISGAGPTVMVIGPGEQTRERLRSWLADHPWGWEIRPLAIADEGARVLPGGRALRRG